MKITAGRPKGLPVSGREAWTDKHKPGRPRLPSFRLRFVKFAQNMRKYEIFCSCRTYNNQRDAPEGKEVLCCEKNCMEAVRTGALCRCAVCRVFKG